MKNKARSKTKTLRVSLILALLLISLASSASADVTAFIGPNRTPVNRIATGAAVGISILVVGFEFEYSDTPEDLSSNAPALKTGMFNILAQTPFGALSGFQLYATTGGGLYRERLGSQQESGFGSNIGGGVKISLAGPFRIRFDYRVFSLRGKPTYRRPQRIYAGLNVAF
jgi:hypothetical protein